MLVHVETFTLNRSGGLSDHIDPVTADYDKMTVVHAEQAKELRKW